MDSQDSLPMLTHSLDAYASGDVVTGSAALTVLLAEQPSLTNPHLLMQAIRRYAYDLLDDPRAGSDRSIQMMRLFLENLPDQLHLLRGFANGELSDWLVTAAYHQYSKGDLSRVRTYLLEAISRCPVLLFDRGILSLLVESWIGKSMMMTYRSAKPRALIRRITIARRKRIIDSYLRSHPVIKLHFGCGNNLLTGWLNSDLSILNRGGVVYIDVTENLPFPENTADFIFSEHLIEHLTYAQGISFLMECYRILRPGGTCRIATPDLEFLHRVYNDRVGTYTDYVRWNIERWVGGQIYSPALVVNNFHRNWGHQMIYDFSTLRQVLENIGFVRITRCPIHQSEQPELRNLERHGEIIGSEFNALETMVIETSKMR